MAAVRRARVLEPHRVVVYEPPDIQVVVVKTRHGGSHQVEMFHGVILLNDSPLYSGPLRESRDAACQDVEGALASFEEYCAAWPLTQETGEV